MKKYKVIFKEPGKKPRFEFFSNGLQFLDSKLGGKPEALKVLTEDEKKICLMFNETAVIQGLDYNFTLMVVPANKKTWIDLIGPVIVYGRDDDDNILDCPLTLEEAEGLFAEPYDE